MATIAPALVTDTKGMADAKTVRTALYSWAFNMTRRAEEPPPEVAKVLSWFERKSLPTSALADRVRVRAVLDALTKKLDGTTAAASTIRRKRAIFHNALGHAVDAGRPAQNPLPQVQWKAPEQVEEELDPATVPDPRQALTLLGAVREQSARGRRLVAFFGCMYYAAARPAEVIGLCVSDCDLPRHGWGVLQLRETAHAQVLPGPTVARHTTDAGSSIARGRQCAPYQSRQIWLPCSAGTSPHTESRLTVDSSARSAVGWSRTPDTGRCGQRPGREP